MGSFPGRIDRNPFAETSRQTVAHLPPAQWVTGTLTPGERHPECEADHSHPLRAQAKNWWGYTFTPPYTFNGCTGTSLSIQRHILTHNTFHSNSRLANQKVWRMSQSHAIAVCVWSSGRYLYSISNPLKTKRRLLYLKTQCVPRCKHFSSRL